LSSVGDNQALLGDTQFFNLAARFCTKLCYQ
jgi:hypothetical protein